MLELFTTNDYGVYDSVIPNSVQLLTTEELRQLAWRFESEARIALKDPGPADALYNGKAASATIGMKSVATALKDIALYEKSTLLMSPEPNAIQKKQLANQLSDQTNSKAMK